MCWITSKTRSSAKHGGLHWLRSLGAKTACAHLPASLPDPSGSRCEGCGSTFNLRLCAACGHVGCCESQAGHARRHALSEHHPVIVSMPVGKGFSWCYEENAYVG